MNDAALFYELADRLDRIEHQLRTLAANGDIAELWLPKKELARRLGVSVRWVDYRIAEGLPHREIGGRVVFRLPTVESWLRTRGLLKDSPTERPGGAPTPRARPIGGKSHGRPER
jgi:hypothetical protein